MSSDQNPLSRRDLLKSAALAGAESPCSPAPTLPRPPHTEPAALRHPAADPGAPSGAATMIGVPFERHDTVRIAIVGTGLRGRSMLNEWVAVPNVKITALCDIVPAKVEMAEGQMKRAGHDYEPAAFTNGGARLRDLRQAR